MAHRRFRFEMLNRILDYLRETQEKEHRLIQQEDIAHAAWIFLEDREAHRGLSYRLLKDHKIELVRVQAYQRRTTILKRWCRMKKFRVIELY